MDEATQDNGARGMIADAAFARLRIIDVEGLRSDVVVAAEDERSIALQRDLDIRQQPR
jgi:hypothetical protein